jgi:alpha-1,2-mannosyltransferase
MATPLSSAADDRRAEPGLPGSARALTAAAALLLLAFVIFVGALSQWTAVGLDLGDFRSYIAAGDAAAHNRTLYEPGSAALPTIGGTFKYPPFAAILFMGLSYVPFPMLRSAVLLTDLIAVLGVVWLSLGMLGYRRDSGRLAATMALGALSLGLQPVAWGMIWGQINLLLMLLVVADLALPGSSRWKGVGIGLATGLKLLPGLFIVYLALTGRRRAAARSAAALVATIGLGFLVMPTQARYFWTHYLRSPDLMARNAYNAENQSLRGEMARLLHNGMIPTAQWLPVGLLVGCAATAVAVGASRRGQELAGLTVCGTATVLVSPISWSHYWVWFIPLLVLGAHLALSRRSGRGAAGLAVAYAAMFAWPVTWIWGEPFLGVDFLPDGHGWLSVLCQGSDVWAGLLIVAVVGAGTVRKRGGPPRAAARAGLDAD